MKAVQTMAATAPGPRHKPRRTGRAAELQWPPKARDVEHGSLRGVRLLPGLNRLLVLGVMAALMTVVHRSDSSVRLQYGRVRSVQRSAPRARGIHAVCDDSEFGERPLSARVNARSAVWGFLGHDATNNPS